MSADDFVVSLYNMELGLDVTFWFYSVPPVVKCCQNLLVSHQYKIPLWSWNRSIYLALGGFFHQDSRGNMHLKHRRVNTLVPIPSSTVDSISLWFSLCGSWIHKPVSIFCMALAVSVCILCFLVFQTLMSWYCWFTNSSLSSSLSVSDSEYLRASVHSLLTGLLTSPVPATCGSFTFANSVHWTVFLPASFLWERCQGCTGPSCHCPMALSFSLAAYFSIDQTLLAGVL